MVTAAWHRVLVRCSMAYWLAGATVAANDERQIEEYWRAIIRKRLGALPFETSLKPTRLRRAARRGRSTTPVPRKFVP